MSDNERDNEMDMGTEKSRTDERRTNQPRIYVASLSDYNAGRLHGRWLDANQEAEDLLADVQAMLASSPEGVAEEWAIHDYEDFGGAELGEYEALATVSLLAAGITEHGEAFGAWSTLVTDSPDELEEFTEHFRGTWPSVEAYAESFLDDLGATQLLNEIPEWLQAYVKLDIAGFARDLVLGGDINAVQGSNGVHIFEAAS